MKLPAQPWMDTAGGQRLLIALGCGEDLTRLVGGTVRDGLLGIAHSDVDFATRLHPDEVIRRLESSGIKAVPTGIAHGTITAVASDLHAEITTLRRDVSTDGRRATVAFTEDWREDASRRDFTINALYARPLTGEVDDFFGGLDDLSEGRVRFIGEPLQRIAEDHLRILRFFRFHARFGKGEPDRAALEACAARANDLMALSRERIRDELLKIVVMPNAEATLRLMMAHGILAPVLPEIEAARLDDLAELAAREAAWGGEPSALRRLGALLPPRPELLRDLGARLRLSKREAEHLAALGARYHSVPSHPFAAAYWDGVDVARDRLLLLGDEAKGAYATLAGWRKPALPIKGKDIIASGITAGPEVSRKLLAFERAWVAAGFPGDADAVEQLIASISG